ncbi:hypothetical protein GCM10009773_18430 [Williamsia serinedens]
MHDLSTPAPPSEPLIPLWVRPVVPAVGVAAVTVPGGGAVSGVIAGEGWAWPGGLRAMAQSYLAIWAAPGDPASRWPGTVSPGPVWAVWTGIVVVLIVAAIAAGMVNSVLVRISDRFRTDHSGLGGRGEMVRLGLTEKAAKDKARNEFGSLRQVKARKIDAARAAIRLGNNLTTNTAIHIQQRDCTMVEGPTGAGKTWRLAVQRCWEAPGFLLMTSTKVDLISAVYSRRAAMGRVEIFDPENITGWPTPMRWSLLSGCEDPAVAIRRADALVKAKPMGDTKNASFWEGKASVLMRCFLHAAAVTGEPLSRVQQWATSRTSRSVIDILREHRPEWAAELAQILTSEADSADDMMSACSSLLAPLADPAIRASVDVPAGESVDLTELVLSGTNTIALVSKGDGNSTAPIVATLAAEIHHLLDRHSQILPQGRLDPPARLVLDEVNNVAPIPELPALMNDSGGRGICIWAFAHNKSQNMARWGRYGGEIFTDSPPCRIVLPGLRGDQELAELSRLCGDRTEWMPTAPGQAPQQRIRPVLTPAQIRQLPEDVALVIFRNAQPMLVHLRSVWEIKDHRKEVLASQRAYSAAAGITQAAAVGIASPPPRWA